MKKSHLFLTSAVAAVSLLAAGCGDDGFENYTVPSSVILADPVLNVSDMSVSLSAVYNGDDKGIAEASFNVWKAGDETSSSRYACDWKDGNASASLKGLSTEGSYLCNFEIKTIGGNIVKADEPAEFTLSRPSGFSLKTTTTVTSKILAVTYSGADEYIGGATLIMTKYDGTQVDNLPEVSVGNGEARAIFFLEDWEEDLFTVKMIFDIKGGDSIETPEFKFSLIPLPENLILSQVKMEDGTFSFSASYDGEDRTVEKGEFLFCDKNGSVIKTLDAVCENRMATASVSGQDYGRYNVTCNLELVDGSLLSAGPMAFTYARPRAYESLTLLPVPMSEAGFPKDAAGAESPYKFTYLDYDWEGQFMYARTSSGKTTIYTSSKLEGWFTNATAFPYGIKAVIVNHSSGKDMDKFSCYAKKSASDDWVKLPDAVKGTPDNKYAFVYDMSASDYDYFKFTTTAQQELKANNYAIEYYTEAPEEY